MNTKQDRSNYLCHTNEEPWQFISPKRREAIFAKENDMESILFLYGHTTKGLVDSIERHYRQICPEETITHVVCQTFIKEVIAAQKGLKQLDEFRTRYTSVDLFIFEDIDMLEAHPASQREFLLIFKMIIELGKGIIITGKHRPSDYLSSPRIEIFDELIDNIMAGLVIEVPATVL